MIYNDELGTTYQRRKRVRMGHAAVAVVILCVFVVTMYAFGVPSVVAIAVGAPLAGISSTIVRRRLLPESPPWSDEERLQLPKIRPVWLPLGFIGVTLLYFVAHIPLVVAGPVVACGIVALVVSELRARRQAEERQSDR